MGAMPLVVSATRRPWAAVFNSIGFTVEPALGGSPLVPGSARDVPPWIPAGPVIQRVAPLRPGMQPVVPAVSASLRDASS